MSRKRLIGRRRTEVIEAHEETILRGVDRRLVGQCRKCPGQALMVSPEKMHEAVGLPVREIWRAVESGSVHFVETQGGELLVCVRSLEHWAQAGNRLRKSASAAAERTDA